MTIDLKPEQERIIQAEIASGHFRDPQEVIDHALEIAVFAQAVLLVADHVQEGPVIAHAVAHLGEHRQVVAKRLALEQDQLSDALVDAVVGVPDVGVAF